MSDKITKHRIYKGYCIKAIVYCLERNNFNGEYSVELENGESIPSENGGGFRLRIIAGKYYNSKKSILNALFNDAKAHIDSNFANARRFLSPLSSKDD